VTELGLTPLMAMLGGAFTVRLKVLVSEVTPLPLAVTVMGWLVTREALLAACRVIVPEFPVPG
jgi:hypothetical protein